MAATYQSDVCATTASILTPSGSEVVAVRGEVAVLDTLAINETLQMVPLPEGCVPVDCILDSDDLDSSTGILMSVGVMNAGLTDLTSDLLITTNAVGQAGGIARMDTKTGPRTAVDEDTLRYIGIKITTAASGTKAAGTVGLTLLYRNA
jgi:hypothetical protein